MFSCGNCYACTSGDEVSEIEGLVCKVEKIAVFTIPVETLLISILQRCGEKVYYIVAGFASCDELCAVGVHEHIKELHLT